MARQRMGQGAKGPGSESSRERIGQGSIGRFVPGSELAWEQKGCESHGTHVTHGTDLIGCRRGEDGASTGTGAV